MKSKNWYTEQYPLHTAAGAGDLAEIIRLHRCDSQTFQKWLFTPDHNGELPLDKVAPRGHFECLKFLVDIHLSMNKPHTNKFNLQKYNPLLAAVRWFFQVLDGSYNAEGVYGVFNTTQHNERDYLRCIDYLIKYYPNYLNLADNKDCTPLYFAVLFLRNGIETQHAKLIHNTKAVIEKLLIAGAHSASVGGSKSARILAAQNSQVWRIFEAIEAKVNKVVVANSSNMAERLIEDKFGISQTTSYEPTKKTRPDKPSVEKTAAVTSTDSNQFLVLRKIKKERYTSCAAVQMVTSSSSSKQNSSIVREKLLMHVEKLKAVCKVSSAEITPLLDLIVTNQSHINALTRAQFNTFCNDVKNCVYIKTNAVGFLFCKRNYSVVTLDRLLVQELLTDHQLTGTVKLKTM